MRIAYLGNFQPDLPPGVRAWSTETHVAEAFELAGHRVTRLQEGEVRAVDVPAAVEGHDLWVWTQTFGLAEAGGTRTEREAMVERVRALGVPSVGLHLDRWWGLAREPQVAEEPFFRLDLAFTADGGSDELWAAAGVRHAWMPPGVHEPECVPGRYRDDYACDVAFVGNWNGYHPESTHRREMVLALRSWFGERFQVWPKGAAVRGRDLADLYASAKVVVGDSCLVGMPGFRGLYLSDRIPETLGRGGFLVHPHVEGVTDGGLYGAYEHLWCWDAGDWDRLRALVTEALDRGPEGRYSVAEAGRRHVLAYHTYTVRVREVVAELVRRGLVSKLASLGPRQGPRYRLGGER